LQGRGFYPGILVGLDRLDTVEYKAKFEEEFERKKNEREAQLKRAQLMAKVIENSWNLFCFKVSFRDNNELIWFL